MLARRHCGHRLGCPAATNSSTSLSLAVGRPSAIRMILVSSWCLLAHAFLCLAYASQLPVEGQLAGGHSETSSNGSLQIKLQLAPKQQQVAPLIGHGGHLAESGPLVIGRTTQSRSFKRRRRLGEDSTSSLVMKLNDNESANDKLRNSGSKRRLANLLVRQLSDLIMNNEPETIRQKLADVEISGQLSGQPVDWLETNQLATAAAGDASKELELARTDTPLLLGDEKGAALLDDLDDDDDEDAYDEEDEENDDDDDDDDEEDDDELNSIVDIPRTQSPVSRRFDRALKRRQTPEADGAKSLSWWPWNWLEHSETPRRQPIATTTVASSSSIEVESQSQANSQGAAVDQQLESSDQNSMVTCPPDYEEQMASLEASINELLQSGGVSGGSGGGANLSVEQRQQLLNGVDLENVLNSSGLSASQHQMALQIQQQLQQQSNCFQLAANNFPTETIMFITKIVTPILFTIIIIVGLLGNIIVVAVIWEDKKYERGEWSPTNLLILDLSIADLSFIIFCIPFTGWDYAVGHWVFGSDWCKANQYLIVVCALSSIYTLVLMSCDRYMAIVYPIECINYRTSGNMLRAIVIKWIAILVFALPTIPMHGLIRLDDGQLFTCRFQTDFYNPLTFQIVFFITSYFLPLVLIFVLYLGLLRRLWCGQKPRGHKESTKALESKKKITRMVASIVVFFAVCWCPIQVMLILMRIKSFEITATYVAIQVFAHTLGYMNSCVNPFIYAFTTDFFYQSFKRSRFGGLCLSWFCCKTNTTNPIGSVNANHQHNNGHNTNGWNVGFGQHRTEATLVVHSTAGPASSNCDRVRAARNSLQFVSPTNTTPTSTTTPTTVTGGQSIGTTLNAPASLRVNKSLGNIFAGQPQATQSAGDPADQSRSSPRPRAQLALEPRDRPQQPSKMQTSQMALAASHNNLVRQQQQKQQQQQPQSPISASTSATQLNQQRCATTKTTTTTSPATTTTTTNGQRKKATSSVELVPRQPTASARVFQSLEQHQQRRQAAEAEAEAVAAGSAAGANQCETKECHPNEQTCLDSSGGQLADDGSCKWCCDSLGSNASTQTGHEDEPMLETNSNGTV